MRTEKQKQIKKQTWKYFWEQKGEEIFNILLILFIIWSIAGVFFQLGWVCEKHDTGFMVDHNFWGSVEEEACNVPYESSLPMWMMISGLITTGIWIIFFFVMWIQSNWEEAERKAKAKYKKSSTKNSKAKK